MQPIPVALITSAREPSDTIAEGINRHGTCAVVGTWTIPLGRYKEELASIQSSGARALVVVANMMNIHVRGALLNITRRTGLPAVGLDNFSNPTIVRYYRTVGVRSVVRMPTFTELAQVGSFDDLVSAIKAAIETHALTGPPTTELSPQDRTAPQDRTSARGASMAPDARPVQPGKQPAIAPGMAPPKPTRLQPVVPQSETNRTRHISLVAVGASTGGPQTVRLILDGLPRPFPVPIVLVQHISPLFSSGFAQWLENTTGFRVTIVKSDAALERDTLYLPTSDRHLFVTSSYLQTRGGPKRNFQRPSVDITFESAADAYGSGLLAVLLTGMGRDGAEGCRAVVDRGGYTIVQDQESSVVHGMPGAAIALGAASEVAAADHIAGRITTLVQQIK